MKRGMLIAAAVVAIGGHVLPAAHADVCHEDQKCWDCRSDGNRICGPGNPQGVLPGWYGDVDCWPGAVWCPDIDAPYSPARVHPGAPKLHTWIGDDSGPAVDLGPSVMPYPAGCEINLYTAQIDCSGAAHGADWDTDPASYLASGPNAWDEGAYVGGYN